MAPRKVKTEEPKKESVDTPRESRSKRKVEEALPESLDEVEMPNSKRSDNNDNNAMSEYERTRLENIRRNEMFLSELGVNGVKSSLVPVAKAKPLTNRTKAPAGIRVPALPTRRSGRVTVDKLAAEVKQLREEGKETEAEVKQAELDAMIEKQKEGAYEVEPIAASSEYESYARLPADPIPLTQFITKQEMAEELQIKFSQLLVSTLTSLSTASTSTASSSTSSSSSRAKKVAASSSSSSSSSPSCPSFLPSDVKVYSKLSLQPEDVVRMTPARITAVALHPSTHKYIAAAGDKNGYVTLWDASYHQQQAAAGKVGSEKDEVDGEDDSFDGLYRYKPHVSNISKLEFSSSSSASDCLYSTSYDGTIRILDLTQASWRQGFVSGMETLSEMYFTDSCLIAADGGGAAGADRTMLISKSNGEVSCIDFRMSNDQYAWNYELHDSKVGSVQVHPLQSQYLLTASNKNGMAIHDLRKLTNAKGGSNGNKAVIKTMDLHSKAINAAYFSPNGEFIVSVSLDDTLRTWKNFLGTANEEVQCQVTRHNNWTGRWLSTFKPAFDPKRGQTMVMGSMLQPRRLEIFTITEKGATAGKKNGDYQLELIYNLQADYLASVNSRNCCHMHSEAILGSNSGGKVHLFR